MEMIKSMVMRRMIMVMMIMAMETVTTIKTWEDVVSKGKRRQIGVRDVDCHKGKEVREGKQ